VSEGTDQPQEASARKAAEVQSAVENLSRHLQSSTSKLDSRPVHPSRVLEQTDLELLAGPAGVEVVNELRRVSFRRYEEACKIQAELESQLRDVKHELRSRGSVLDFVEELGQDVHHAGVRQEGGGARFCE
jgi:hypothetical protein